MLNKRIRLKEKKSFLNHLKNFKKTKVYNYKNHIFAIFAIGLLVISFAVIMVNNNSISAEPLIPTVGNHCTILLPSLSIPEKIEEGTIKETVNTTIVETTTIVATSTTAPPTTKKVTEKQTTTQSTTEKKSEAITTEQSKLIGRFKITVYCACSKCCGKYGVGRPVDKNGNPIVYGASGRVLIPKYSIAVDPKIISLGKEVVFNGKTYRADDTGGSVKGNVIDIYAGTSHNEALQIAHSMKSQYAEVYWK